MTTNYLKPGIAAIALALLFPLYWSFVLVFGPASEDLAEALTREFTTVDWLDALFIVIGVLEVYVLVSLVRSFKERFNSSLAKAVIYIMISAVVLFHGVVVVDFYLSMFKGELSEDSVQSAVAISVYLAVSGLVIYLIAGFILSIVLLANSKDLANELKYFAILFLIICILGATILLSAFNLLLFPAALIMLAVYFLKDPDSLEVV